MIYVTFVPKTLLMKMLLLSKLKAHSLKKSFISYLRILKRERKESHSLFAGEI